MRIAVIMFPGNNCENETKRAIEAAGIRADVVRWNQPIGDYEGYVLPGGFSYEDRIRAGVIASKDPVVGKLRQEAADGKVILGICNGCQVLVEAGIIPGLGGKVEMAIAPNINPMVSGFYCSWIRVRNSIKRKTAFNIALQEGEMLQMPIAHGEGRFAAKDKALVQKLIRNEQLALRYCDENGNIADKFPHNPNGSLINIAGVVNEKGNVMAMMPHPERSSWMRQVPEQHYIGEDAGPGLKIFQSIKGYLKR